MGWGWMLPSRAAAFVAIGVRKLTHQVFIPAFAMRHQRGQVALRAGWEEQARLLAGALGHGRLQAVDAGIVAHHVVAHRRGHHGLEHGGRRPVTVSLRKSIMEATFVRDADSEKQQRRDGSLQRGGRFIACPAARG